MARLMNAKQIAGIDCDGPVHAGLTVALETRLEEMCALRDAALDWSDPEGVHQMRVASRRLRGALRDFAPYLGKRRISSCLKRIRDIAQALGRVRDYDVSILTLERTAAKAPAKVSAGIRRFAELRHAERQEARAELTPILTLESLAELTEEFKGALEGHATLARSSRSQRQNVTAASQLTYREVARSIILTRLEELERLSTSLYHPLNTKPLHDMRIEAKHLRYALELLEQCWGPPVALFAGRVAELQSSLGKLHDCDVWIEDFGELAQGDVSDPDFDHRVTVVWLLCHFVKLRGKHMSSALMQWQQWQAREFSARLRESILATSAVSQLSKEDLSMNES